MYFCFISLAFDAIFYQVYYPLVSSWPKEVLSDFFENFWIFLGDHYGCEYELKEKSGRRSDKGTQIFISVLQVS